MCQNLGYSSELQSPFFTKFSDLKDLMLSKMGVRNCNTNRFHVFLRRKLFGFCHFFKKWVNGMSPVIVQSLGLPIWKMKWVYIYSAQKSVGGHLRAHDPISLFMKCYVWLIKEKKWRQFILLFTESPRYEMLIILTRNTVQIKILLDDCTTNWRENQRGLITGKIPKCFLRRSI